MANLLVLFIWSMLAANVSIGCLRQLEELRGKNRNCIQMDETSKKICEQMYI